jgi:predicted house-cleaning noncanonical NTP pyrophosphatase (MazG superfamily)
MSESRTQTEEGSDETNASNSVDGSNRTDVSLTRDEIFEVLSNQRRRYAFHYLRQHEGDTVDVGELAEQIASWETGKAAELLTAAERKRVKTALHQFHLPKMHDLRFVEYDSHRGDVRLTDEISDVEIYLDIVPGLDVPWGYYYLGISGFNFLLLAGVWADVPLFSTVPALSLATFFVIVYALSATFHAYWNHTQTRFGVDEHPPKVDGS